MPFSHLIRLTGPTRQCRSRRRSGGTPGFAHRLSSAHIEINMKNTKTDAARLSKPANKRLVSQVQGRLLRLVVPRNCWEGAKSRIKHLTSSSCWTSIRLLGDFCQGFQAGRRSIGEPYNTGIATLVKVRWWLVLIHVRLVHVASESTRPSDLAITGIEVCFCPFPILVIPVLAPNCLGSP